MVSVSVCVNVVNEVSVVRAVYAPVLFLLHSSKTLATDAPSELMVYEKLSTLLIAVWLN